MPHPNEQEKRFEFTIHGSNGETRKPFEADNPPNVMYGDGSGVIVTFRCEHDWLPLGIGEYCPRCHVMRRSMG